VPRTKAYELTHKEVRLVKGFRQGRVDLSADGNWLWVTPREARTVLLLRRIGHGPVTVHLKNGEPAELEAGVHVRLHNGQDEERMKVIEELRSEM
jgi:hypothetical protein